jgi:hypothetical protein
MFLPNLAKELPGAMGSATILVTAARMLQEMEWFMIFSEGL